MVRGICKVVIGLVVALSSTAYGQYGQPGPGGPGDTTAAAQAVQTAQRDLRSAQEIVERIEAAAKADLASNPQWAAAMKQQAQARAEAETTKTAVRKELEASAEYSAAKQTLEKTEAALGSAAQVSLTSKQVKEQTDVAINARYTMANMEDRAYADSAELKLAQQRLAYADAEVDRLWQAYKRENLDGNRAYVAAVRQVSDAEVALQYARGTLRDARNAAAERAAQARPNRAVGTGTGVSRRGTGTGTRSTYR